MVRMFQNIVVNTAMKYMKTSRLEDRSVPWWPVSCRSLNSYTNILKIVTILCNLAIKKSQFYSGS